VVRLAAVVLGLGLIVACGAGGTRPAVDAGPADAAAPDAFSCASCVAPVPVCNQPETRCDQCATSPDCTGLPFTGVCADGACRECAGDGDCGGGALGPSCDVDRGYCRCTDAGDCAGNANGGVCDATLGACGCTGDGDCAGTATCQLQPYLGPGAKTCQ
jgi:hypothetical protein